MESDRCPGIRHGTERRGGWSVIQKSVPSTLESSADFGIDYVTKTGTTVVTRQTTHSVTSAADRRASFGGQFVASERQQNIELLHPTAAIALSGAVGDILANGGESFENVPYPGEPEEFVTAWCEHDSGVLAGTTQGQVIGRSDEEWVTIGFVPDWIRSMTVTLPDHESRSNHAD